MEINFHKNDIVNVKVEDLGSSGEGIGKVNGITLFIKDAVLGDTVEARIVKVKKNYAYARLEKVITPSPFRVTPKCIYHKQCGGCQIQALSYEKQLEFKQNKVRSSLIRIGGFSEELIDQALRPIIGMENPYYYRNKAQFPVGYDKEGNLITGFYAGRTHHIVANTDCALGVPENQEILERTLEFMRENQVTAYEETTGKGLVRHVLIRKGFRTGQLMVCLVINGKKLPAAERFVESMRQVKNMTSLSINYNEENTNVILGKDGKLLWGKPWIEDSVRELEASVRWNETGEGEYEAGMKVTEAGGIAYKDGGKEPEAGKAEAEAIVKEQEAGIKTEEAMTDRKNNVCSVRAGEDGGHKSIGDGGDKNTEEIIFKDSGRFVTFHISPQSFYQVNPVQMEKLYSLALRYAGLTGKETVWDLYCGIGTISLFLAAHAKKVYGVEIVPQAIEDAKENARLNGITNAEFFVGKAEEVFPGEYEKNGVYADVIVVDPPRKGCGERCLNTILRMQPERVVYISCDPATLARDLKVLGEGGYELKEGAGCDLFPGTIHCEVCVELCRK